MYTDRGRVARIAFQVSGPVAFEVALYAHFYNGRQVKPIEVVPFQPEVQISKVIRSIPSVKNARPLVIHF